MQVDDEKQQVNPGDAIWIPEESHSLANNGTESVFLWLLRHGKSIYFNVTHQEGWNMAEEKGKNPKGAGKSSFDLIDLKKISDVLPVKPGSVVLDLACGRGDYSVYFSEIVGEQGLVYALDLWEEGTKLLEKRIEKQNITNIMTLISDAARPVRPNISGCRKKRWMIWSWGTDLKKAVLLMQGITPIC
jgi:2-polyprenyl-3-methyl-5-hydroxy-6-metoxy-1,4-benzoquinol methylase